MKERPILFKGEMVRAILDGRKTQTRRLDGFAAINENPDDYQFLKIGEFQGEPHAFFHQISTGHQILVKCKKGRPGDRLWVKETFLHAEDFHGKDVTWFRADHDTWPGQWKPSIFMPCKLSRITLEIVGVRVERLHEISEANAIAEGIIFDPHLDGFCYNSEGCGFHGSSAVRAYENLWRSINGPGSWEANPFVWVITFRTLPRHDSGKPPAADNNANQGRGVGAGGH